jgi:hypothetical protein
MNTGRRVEKFIGGTVSGLASGQSVVLQNNGGDDETVNANGNFTFDTEVAYGGSYYITIEPAVGTTLTNVEAADNPSLDDMPSNSEFTYGLFDFTINGIDAGGADQLTIYLPAGAAPASYYKYGHTPGESSDRWYEFMFDGVTGAQIDGNVITLYFVDAEKWDDVLIPDSMINEVMFNRTGCFDVGPMCGGWGHVQVEMRAQES